MSPDDASFATEVRVLVVDDHPFFREGIVAWILRQKNLTCCGLADSPATALEAIQLLKPDIVLLDLQLRGGDAFELLRQLKDVGHTARVIIVSHKDETIFAERCLRAGARGYVLKEEASDVMLVALRTVLNGGVHVSDAIRRHLLHTGDPSNGPAGKVRDLYNRELQVLQLLGRGRTTKEIADQLGISPKTVESYRESLKKKLGLPDSLTLVRFATMWDQDSHRLPQDLDSG